MSIFWIGGPEKIVPDAEIKREMYEDRVFLPGILHGGDYLIRIYLNDVCLEDEPDKFVTEYLTREVILKAHEKDPSHTDVFNEILLEESENFTCCNDGKTGEFAALVEAWDKTVKMSNSDLVEWAKHNKTDINQDNIKEVLEAKVDEIYLYFQNANNIKSGNISIPNTFVQDKLVNRLAYEISHVLNEQKKGEKYE